MPHIDLEALVNDLGVLTDDSLSSFNQPQTAHAQGKLPGGISKALDDARPNPLHENSNPETLEGYYEEDESAVRLDAEFKRMHVSNGVSERFFGAASAYGYFTVSPFLVSYLDIS